MASSLNSMFLVTKVPQRQRHLKLHSNFEFEPRKI